MKVEIGTETAQFPEKEYINGIFVAVVSDSSETLDWKIIEQRNVIYIIVQFVHLKINCATL